MNRNATCGATDAPEKHAVLQQGMDPFFPLFGCPSSSPSEWALAASGQVINVSMTLLTPLPSTGVQTSPPPPLPEARHSGSSYPIEVRVYRLSRDWSGVTPLLSPCIRLCAFHPMRPSQETLSHERPEWEAKKKNSNSSNSNSYSNNKKEEEDKKNSPFSTYVIHTVDDMLALLPSSVTSWCAASEFSIPALALLLLGWGGPALLPSSTFSTSSSFLFSTLEDFLSYFLDGDSLAIDMVVSLPQGSGLGTSSTLAGALLYALRKYVFHCCPTLAHQKAPFVPSAARLTRATTSEGVSCAPDEKIHSFLTAEEEEEAEMEECARLTVLLEQLLGTGGGWQDAFGALFPGVKHLACTVHCPERKRPVKEEEEEEKEEEAHHLEHEKVLQTKLDTKQMPRHGESESGESPTREKSEMARSYHDARPNDSSIALQARASCAVASSLSLSPATTTASRWSWPFFSIHRYAFLDRRDPRWTRSNASDGPSSSSSVQFFPPPLSPPLVPSAPWIFTLPELAPRHLLYFTGIPREGPPVTTQVAASMFLHSPLVLHALDTMRHTVVRELTALLSAPPPPPPPPTPLSSRSTVVASRIQESLRQRIASGVRPLEKPTTMALKDERWGDLNEDPRGEALCETSVRYREKLWQRYGELIQQSQELNHRMDPAYSPPMEAEEGPSSTDGGENVCRGRQAVVPTTVSPLPRLDTAAVDSSCSCRKPLGLSLSSSERLHALFQVIAPHVYGAKLCGAGGGGFLYMVAKRMDDVHSLTQLLTPASSSPTMTTTLSSPGSKSEETKVEGKDDGLLGTGPDTAVFTPHPDAFFTSFTITSGKGVIWEPLEEEDVEEEK